MNTIFDVANWFLAQDHMTHKKLQKLCYYAQAWSCAICPKPISDAVFEAWIHGPVCRTLYNQYKEYKFQYIPKIENYTSTFSLEEEEFLQDVWLTYGGMTANSLEALTHTEPPWQKARLGCDSGEQCNNPIDENDMAEYYRNIYIGGDA